MCFCFDLLVRFRFGLILPVTMEIFSGQFFHDYTNPVLRGFLLFISRFLHEVAYSDGIKQFECLVWLGISRKVPTVKDLYAIGRGLETHGIDGLVKSLQAKNKSGEATSVKK